MKFHKADDIIQVRSVKVMIYGPPGVHKTSFAATASNPWNLDWDDGIRRVNPKFRCDYGVPESWNDAVSTISEVDFSGYDTIVNDTISASQDFLIEHIKRTYQNYKQPDGSLTTKGYGALKTIWKQGLYTTLESLGKDLIFIAHHGEDKIKRGKEEEIFLRPDIVGGTLKDILKKMDLVGYMDWNNGRLAISFSGKDGTYFAKNSANLPDIMYLDETSMAEIIDKFRNAVNADSKQFQAYNKQMEEIYSMLDSSKDAATLNKLVQYCAELTSKNQWIATARVEAKQLINDAAIELKLERDKSGMFIEPQQEQDTHEPLPTFDGQEEYLPEEQPQQAEEEQVPKEAPKEVQTAAKNTTRKTPTLSNGKSTKSKN